MATDGKKSWSEILRPAWALVEFDRRELLILWSYVVALGAISAAIPFVSQVAVNQTAFTGDAYPVFVLAVVVLAAMMMGAAIKLFQLRVIELLAKRVLARTAYMSVRSLLNREPSSHDLDDREPAAKFFDVASFQTKFAVLISDGVSLLVLSLLGTAALAFYHPYLLSFSVLVVVACWLILAVSSKRAIEACSERSAEKYRTAHWVSEVAQHGGLLRQAPESQALGRLTDRFVGLYVRSHFAYMRVLMAQGGALFVLQAFASAAYFGVGGWLVVQGKINLGQLVAAEIIILSVLGSVGKLNYYLDTFYEVLVSAQKIHSLTKLADATQEAGQAERPAAVIEFEAKSSLLREPLVARPGDVIALRGPRKGAAGELFAAIASLDHRKAEVSLKADAFVSRASTMRSILLVNSACLFRLSLADNLELLAEPREEGGEGGAILGLRVLRPREKERSARPLRDHEWPLQERARIAVARALFSDRPIVLIEGIFDAMEVQDQIAFILDFRERHPQKILLIQSAERAIDPHVTRVALFAEAER